MRENRALAALGACAGAVEPGAEMSRRQANDERVRCLCTGPQATLPFSMANADLVRNSCDLVQVAPRSTGARRVPKPVVTGRGQRAFVDEIHDGSRREGRKHGIAAISMAGKAVCASTVSALPSKDRRCCSSLVSRTPAGHVRKTRSTSCCVEPSQLPGLRRCCSLTLHASLEPDCGIGSTTMRIGPVAKKLDSAEQAQPVQNSSGDPLFLLPTTVVISAVGFRKDILKVREVRHDKKLRVIALSAAGGQCQATQRPRMCPSIDRVKISPCRSACTVNSVTTSCTTHSQFARVDLNSIWRPDTRSPSMAACPVAQLLPSKAWRSCQGLNILHAVCDEQLMDIPRAPRIRWLIPRCPVGSKSARSPPVRAAAVAWERRDSVERSAARMSFSHFDNGRWRQ